MHYGNGPIEFAERRSNGVSMAIVQARQHGPSVKINPLHSRLGSRQHLAVRTYLDEMVVGYQERLGYRELAPLCDYLAIVKDDLGAKREIAHQQGCTNCRQESNHHRRGE